MEILSQNSELALWLLVALLAMVLLAVLIIIISGTSFRRIINEEEERHALVLVHQKNLLNSSLKAQEAERERMAADLHDELASRLSVARLTLQLPHAAQQQSEKTPIQLIDEVLEMARRIAHDLNPPLLERMGLVTALADFLQPLQQSYDLNFYSSEHFTGRFSLEKERQFFRIVQECVHNAIKHAAFTKLFVGVRITADSVVVLVKDNGIGFEIDPESGGAGLKSIESRVQMIGGHFRIQSHELKGTKILVSTKIKSHEYDTYSNSR